MLVGRWYLQIVAVVHLGISLYAYGLHAPLTSTHCHITMMTSSNENIFRVTSLLCGEFTGPRPHKNQWHGALMFSLIRTWTNSWENNSDAGVVRRYRAHYDVIVMIYYQTYIELSLPWTIHKTSTYFQNYCVAVSHIYSSSISSVRFTVITKSFRSVCSDILLQFTFGFSCPKHGFSLNRYLLSYCLK